MDSFRNAATFRHVVAPLAFPWPSNQIPTMRWFSQHFATSLGIPPPTSLRYIVELLEGDSVVYNSPPNIGGQDIDAHANFGINNNGYWWFTGHVHDSGPTAYNYVCAVSLIDVKDSKGNTPVLYHQGKVHGTFDPGSRDDSWDVPNQSAVFAENWDAVKRSRCNFGFHAATDLGDITEDLLIGLFVGAADTIHSINLDWFKGGALGQGINCSTDTDDDGNPRLDCEG
ncbi:MAG: hypothetical protein WBZ36_05915 [Candidatus Nitrosopolaris sp.]